MRILNKPAASSKRPFSKLDYTAFDREYMWRTIERYCKTNEQKLLAGHKFRYIKHKTPAKILAVAHCDVVANRKAVSYNADRSAIISGALDDRLGVAILVDILPKLCPDFKFDVLLTTDEEKCNSTAQLFPAKFPDTKYDWMFQFDRAGCDVVTYDYYNSSAEHHLTNAGWDIQYGSYSDICELGSLGIWGANFGCGYHSQHSDQCHAYYHDIVANILRFVAFASHAYGTQYVSKPRYDKYSKYGYSVGNVKYGADQWTDKDYWAPTTFTTNSRKGSAKYPKTGTGDTFDDWTYRKDNAIYDPKDYDTTDDAAWTPIPAKPKHGTDDPLRMLDDTAIRVIQIIAPWFDTTHLLRLEQRATPEQIRKVNDVCAVHYYDLTSLTGKHVLSDIDDLSVLVNFDIALLVA